jgi:hypothetical protein
LIYEKRLLYCHRSAAVTTITKTKIIKGIKNQCLLFSACLFAFFSVYLGLALPTTIQFRPAAISSKTVNFSAFTYKVALDVPLRALPRTFVIAAALALLLTEPFCGYYCLS